MKPRPVRELGLRAPWLHEGGLSDIGFARDGRVLTVGPRSVRTWMLATGELAAETDRGPRDGSQAGATLAPLADRWVCSATLGDRREFRIWNLSTGAYLGELPIPGDGARVMAVDARATRALLFTDEGRWLTLFALDEGRVLATLDTGETLPGQDRPYLSAVFLGDGSVVSGDVYGGIVRWNPDGSDRRQIVGPLFQEDGVEGNRLNELVGAPDAAFFAAVYSDGLRVYDGTGQLRQLAVEFYAPVAFSARADRLVSRDHSRLVVFDEAGAELQAWSLEALPASRLAMSADGRWVAFGTDDGRFTAKEVGAAPAPHAVEARRRDVLPGPANSLSPTTDGRALVIGCSDGSLLSWALEAKTPVHLPSHGYDGSISARVRDDGRVVSAGAGFLRCLTPGGALEMECIAPYNTPVWSPNGRIAGYVGREHAQLVDTATGRTRGLAIGGAPADDPRYFDAGAISNAGRFAIATLTRLAIHDPSGRLLREVTFEPLPPTPVEGVRFGFYVSLAFVTEDVLAFGDSERGGGVVHVDSGERILAATTPMFVAGVDPHRGRIAFRVLRDGPEWGMVVWDPATRRLVELETSDGPYLAAFLPDGLHLVTATADRRIVIWEVPA